MEKSPRNNRYFLMRHGRSTANEAALIISDPAVGTKEYGLSDEGAEQVRKAARSFRPEGACVICSSDFLRTAETARILAKALGVDDIFFTEKLRERFFGSYEGKSNRFYEEVWEKDRDSDTNVHMGVESPRSVADRTASLLGELEEKYRDSDIVLVSHGDCLQIMQTVFENCPPRSHRSLPHLETAEIRAVRF